MKHLYFSSTRYVAIIFTLVSYAMGNLSATEPPQQNTESCIPISSELTQRREELFQECKALRARITEIDGYIASTEPNDPNLPQMLSELEYLEAQLHEYEEELNRLLQVSELPQDVMYALMPVIWQYVP